MKLVLAMGLVAVVASLAAALFFMLRGKPQDGKPNNQMARALAVRIALSVAVFLCLLMAWRLGYIQPTGLPVGR